MELSGEYVGCDGEPRRLQVSCEASGDADPLRSLSAGVARMKELVAELFGSLAEGDAQGVPVDPDDASDGDDEDDAEDENNIGNRTNSDGPSAKRPKPTS
ncbi:EKC/KEOPS complex subunit GON7 isoform X1 [Meriones unguiculatus]|uniref:EKC/KEOPS complex subunit GON7 isoform X1 n=1 Tax=Meriones unguiculatus TaxID=10047 RepID=UPI000B4F224F|nr:EKC/KEOPS complex subunit GON7 isoform X1 [Meriones unguiculatus]